MARELLKVGGVFNQMEDEITSIGAIVGASMGGAKAMTATSGPGFSLKQGNLGCACASVIPCVIINVMRGGPSTGIPTRPAQGDIMQARWGTHGDHPMIVLTPASVAECYTETIRAFELTERLRVPVIVLVDEVIGHLVETVDLEALAPKETIERRFATGPADGFEPYAVTDDMAPPFPHPGDGYRSHTTGLTHLPSGFPTQNPEKASAALLRTTDKLDLHADLIEACEIIECDNADIIIATIGISARAAKQAVTDLRAKGIKAGLFRPKTLWPFPEKCLKEATKNAKTILVPEMNQGQLIHEIERLMARHMPVIGLNKINGEAITPAEITAKVSEVLA